MGQMTIIITFHTHLLQYSELGKKNIVFYTTNTVLIVNIKL